MKLIKILLFLFVFLSLSPLSLFAAAPGAGGTSPEACSSWRIWMRTDGNKGATSDNFVLLGKNFRLIVAPIDVKNPVVQPGNYLLRYTDDTARKQSLGTVTVEKKKFYINQPEMLGFEGNFMFTKDFVHGGNVQVTLAPSMELGGLCTLAIPVGSSTVNTCTIGATSTNPCETTKTVFGPLANDPGVVAGQLLKIGTFMAGGVALILMIIAVFRIITSRGNPDSLQGGRELFTSALIGLLLVIFAVVILQLIGRDIIGIPNFGFNPHLTATALTLGGYDVPLDTGLKTNLDSLGAILSAFLPAVLAIAGMVAFIYFLLGGFKYLVSRGDPKALDSAKSTITTALIGLLIIVGIFTIIAVIQAVLHIQITSVPPTYAASGDVDLGSAFKFGSSGVQTIFPSFGSLISAIIAVVIPLGGIIFFFLLILGGIKFMLSHGDDKAKASARGTITSALIGLLIILASFLIIKVFEGLTGVKVT